MLPISKMRWLGRAVTRRVRSGPRHSAFRHRFQDTDSMSLAGHDLIVIGQAFRAYYRWRAADGESEADARTKPANRYLMITASACRVDQQEDI